jgi:hypothetical protein
MVLPNGDTPDPAIPRGFQARKETFGTGALTTSMRARASPMLSRSLHMPGCDRPSHTRTSRSGAMARILSAASRIDALVGA